MGVVLLVMGGLAVAMHGWIFVMESLRWEHPATRRVFGMSPEEARQTNELAFNQGFYNLFLAIVLGVGLPVRAAGESGAGAALVVAGAGSMLGAAVVLVARSPARARAAVGQGLFPALTLVALALA